MLRQAGSKGATLAQVKGRAKQVASDKEAALVRLEAAGIAVRVGSAKSPKFFHKEHYQAPAPEDFKGAILAALEVAKEQGCIKTVLAKKSAERLAALNELVAECAVVDIGTARSPRFVLPLYHRPLELAYEAVDGKATPGVGKLYSRTELGKGLAGAVAAKVDEAIDLLVLERKLIPLKRGSAIFYVHYASLEGLLPVFEAGTGNETGAGTKATLDAEHDAAQVRSQGVPAPEFDFEVLQQAYQRLVSRRPGYLDVLIADLQREASVPLDGVKRALIEASRAGRVVPTLGDNSLSNPENSAAGLEIGGELYFRIRFL